MLRVGRSKIEPKVFSTTTLIDFALRVLPKILKPRRVALERLKCKLASWN